MGTVDTVLELLDKKRGFFADYERATNQMLTADIDGMEVQMARRNQLVQEIDKIDAAMARLCAGPGGETLHRAIKNKCARDELPPELQEVYDAAQAIFPIMNRVRNSEPQVAARMRSQRDELEVKIKEMNQSVTAKASKFMGGYQTGPDAGTFLKSKYHKA